MRREGVQLWACASTFGAKFLKETLKTTAVLQKSEIKFETLVEIFKRKQNKVVGKETRHFQTLTLFKYGYPADLSFYLELYQKGNTPQICQNTVTHWLEGCSYFCDNLVLTEGHHLVFTTFAHAQTFDLCVDLDNLRQCEI